MKKFILSIMIALTFVLPAHAVVYKEISTTDTKEIKTALKEIVPAYGKVKYSYDDYYEINFRGPLQSAIGNFFFYNYHLNQCPDLEVSFIFLTGEEGKTKVKAAFSMIENPDYIMYARRTYDIANNRPSQAALYNILEELEERINPEYIPVYKDKNGKLQKNNTEHDFLLHTNAEGIILGIIISGNSGVKKGDKIIEVNGKDFKNIRTEELEINYRSGNTIYFLINRNGENILYKIKKPD